MSTVDSKSLIRKLIAKNGFYESDPQVHSIWSYKTIEGQKTQAVFYDARHVDIHESPYVIQPELLWSRVGGLTFAGKLWLVENKEKE